MPLLSAGSVRAADIAASKSSACSMVQERRSSRAACDAVLLPASDSRDSDYKDQNDRKDIPKQIYKVPLFLNEPGFLVPS